MDLPPKDFLENDIFKSRVIRDVLQTLRTFGGRNLLLPLCDQLIPDNSLQLRSYLKYIILSSTSFLINYFSEEFISSIKTLLYSEFISPL